MPHQFGALVVMPCVDVFDTQAHTRGYIDTGNRVRLDQILQPLHLPSLQRGTQHDAGLHQQLNMQLIMANTVGLHCCA